jgi:hypothetical protein
MARKRKGNAASFPTFWAPRNFFLTVAANHWNTSSKTPRNGVPDCSIGRDGGASKSAYELLGCKLGFRLGRAIIWRHDATHRVVSVDNHSLYLRDNGRTPVSRFSLVGDYRKLRNVSH